MILRLLLLLWFALLPTAQPAFADDPVAAPAQAVLQVFVREGCPHCTDAKIFLAELAQARPDLRIVYRWVDRDPAARDELMVLSRDAGSWPPSSTVRLPKSRFLRNRASVHAGYRPFSQKILWWHVCNNGTQS